MSTPTVSETVFEQYREIQREGVVNMLNKTGVQKAASERGYAELVVFIEDADYYNDLIRRYEEIEARVKQT